MENVFLRRVNNPQHPTGAGKVSGERNEVITMTKAMYNKFIQMLEDAIFEYNHAVKVLNYFPNDDQLELSAYGAMCYLRGISDTFDKIIGISITLEFVDSSLFSEIIKAQINNVGVRVRRINHES